MGNWNPRDWQWSWFGSVFSTIGSWIEGFFRLLRAIVVDSLVVGAIVLLVAVGWREVMRPDTVIEEIVLPKALSDLGYSGQVAAMRLVDAVNRLNEEAQRLSDLDQETSLIPSSRQFEFVESQTGLSLRTVSAAIDSLFPGRRTRVAGEFVCPKKACKIEDLQLRLRVFDGSELAVATAGPIAVIGENATEGAIEDYFRRSAVELLKVLDPIVVAERLAASATAEPYVPEFGDQGPVLEEAIRLSKSLVRRGHDDDARAAALLGQIFSLSGNRVEAERWFARVVTVARPEEAPLVATAEYLWGEMLDRESEGIPEAKEKWNNAARIFAASAENGELGSSYLMWQGLTLQELGDFDDAKAVYERWVAAEPDDPGARFQLAYLLANPTRTLGNSAATETAIEAFKFVLDIDPTHYTAHNEIGVLLSNSGRPVASLEYYATAAFLSRNHPVVADNLRFAVENAVVADRAGACALIAPGAGTQALAREQLAPLLASHCAN